MGENATPDESVQIVFDGDTVADTDNPLPVAVVSGGSGGGPATIADGADVTQGAKADAAWNGTPGSTTIMAVLKAIYAKVAATLGFSVNAGTTDSTTLRVITASDGPLNTNLGATTDAAVVTDANGSVSGKVRGLVKIFADVWNSTLHYLGVTLVPATSGGLSIYRNLDVQTTGVQIKSGAGQIYWLFASNLAATVRFIKFYDTNTNPPTSAMTPVLTIAIPAGSGGTFPIPHGLVFASGIGIRASSALADNDATAPTANDVVVNLGYK